MQDSLIAQIAQAPMSMHNLDLLPNDDVPKDWKERKDGGECGGTVDDEKWDMVDFETIGEIADTCPSFVGVCYDDHFVSSIDELRGELVDVTFDSTRLGEEEIADHRDLVRHSGGE